MTLNLYDPVRNPNPNQQQQPRLGGLTEALQAGIGGFNTGLGIMDAINSIRGSKLDLQQKQVQTRDLLSQENIKNTVNRLQEGERLIAAGATPQQLEQTLLGYIKESEARGGNPIDSIQALEALRAGGVQGLSNILGQAKQAFIGQGLIAPQGLSEERKLNILGQQKLELEALKGEQELALVEFKANLDAQPDKLAQSDSLRKEVIEANKRLKFDDTRGAFGRIQASNDGTPAGDLALIFNYMKLLDPGSVVREGEFATAQNATGVPQRVVNAYNQLLSGERLNPAQRKNFTDQAEKIFNQSEANFKTAINPLLNIGKSRGLTQDDILGEGYFDSLGVTKVALDQEARPVSQPQAFTSPNGIQFTVE